MIKVWLPYVIAAVCISMYAREGCKNRDLSRQIETLYKSKDSAVNEVITWKDKFNIEHATAEQIGMDIKVMEARSEKIASVLDVKPSNIQRITVTQSKINYRDTLIIRYKDSLLLADPSVKESYLMKQDKWMRIMVDLNSFVISISGNDTLTVAEYYKRKWLFGERKTYIDVSHANPYITSTSVQGYAVKTRSPLFIVGPSLSVGIQGQFVPGVSILFYPLTLKIGK